MRRLLPGDLLALASAIEGREAAEMHARLIIRRAELADRYLRRFGRVHAQWGDGTLASAARLSGGAAGIAHDSVSGLTALSVAAGAVAAWKRETAEFNRPRRIRSASPTGSD